MSSSTRFEQSTLHSENKHAIQHILIKQTFSMRYCMTPCTLKEYQKYNMSKLKLINLFYRNWTFNFDLLYIWYPLRYRVIQFIIGKLSHMLNMLSHMVNMRGLSYGSTFEICQDIMKSVNLVHNCRFIHSQVVGTVII